MKPLVWKELRENVRWLPIGLVVVSVICWMVLPSSMDNYQSVLIASELVSRLAIVLPLLVFALGVVQSFRDLQPAAGAYLNHRGVTSSDIFFSKTISGFVLYLVSVLVPIVLLAGWIAYRGMWWHPMRPAQVGPAIVYAFAAFVMHPAAMLTMARGASWWRTRLFPLVPAGAVLIFYFGLLRDGGPRGEVIGMLFAVPMLVWAILISRQGWLDLSKDPPASRTNIAISRRFLLPAYLLVGACGVFVTALLTSVGVVEEMARAGAYVPAPYTRFAVDAVSGDPYFTTVLQEFDETNGRYTEKLLGGDIIADGKTVNPMSSIQPDKKLLALTSLIETGKGYFYYQSDGFFTGLSGLEFGNVYSYDERGYVLLYETYPVWRWSHTISADGIHPAGVLSGERLSNDALGHGGQLFSSIRGLTRSSALVDSHGVAFIEKNPMAVRRIIDHQVDAAALVLGDAGGAPRMFILEANKLFEYQLYDEKAGQTWYKESEEGSGEYDTPIEPHLKPQVKLVQTYTVPDELLKLRGLSFVAAPNGLWFNVGVDPTTVFHLRFDGTNERLTFSIDESSKTMDPDVFRFTFVLAGMIPGVLILFGIVMGVWELLHRPDYAIAFSGFIAEVSSHPIIVCTWVVSLLLALAAGWWLVRRVARTCALTGAQTKLWSWSVLFLGLAAPLAMVAIYRKVHRETCPKCSERRRVDLTHCEHCGAAWEEPASEGIEILDRAA